MENQTKKLDDLSFYDELKDDLPTDKGADWVMYFFVAVLWILIFAGFWLFSE
ncbi:hypothetical protein [Tellurirhabdus bombi]|uniref:hypothetical protein n=1 Tax=Tellurirhabdus bombi TaxID=2907205 RepID=UPI001F226BFF|nr:hypothetical protein [Tellurirhabdus bombi]